MDRMVGIFLGSIWMVHCLHTASIDWLEQKAHKIDSGIEESSIFAYSWAQPSRSASIEKNRNLLKLVHKVGVKTYGNPKVQYYLIVKILGKFPRARSLTELQMPASDMTSIQQTLYRAMAIQVCFFWLAEQWTYQIRNTAKAESRS